MNEQLENAVSVLIEKSLTSLDKGVDFLTAEVPEVIKQLFMWEMVSSSLLVFLFSCIIFGLIKFIKSIMNSGDEHWSKYKYNKQMHEGGVFSVLISVFMIVGSSLVLVKNAAIVLKITVAPKLWLIEYAADLVK